MTTELFRLLHVHAFGDQPDCVKMIGLYASHEAACAARRRAAVLEGFRDLPDAFVLERYRLAEDGWSEGFTAVSEGDKRQADDPSHHARPAADGSPRLRRGTLVHRLYHVHGFADPERDENTRLVGIYATEAEAAAARDRTGRREGFRDDPEAFQIHPCRIGQRGWTSGFVTIRR